MKVVFQLVLFALFTLGSVIANSSNASGEEVRISFRKRCGCRESTSRIPEITEPTSRIPEITEPTSRIPEITEPTSRIPEITEPTSRIPEITEPTSRIPEITEPTSRIPEITEPTSRIPEITEPTARDNFKKAILEEMKIRILIAMNLTRPRTIGRSLFFLQSFNANSSSWDNRARNFSDDYSGYKNWNNHAVRSEIVANSCQNENEEQCARFRIPVPEFLSNSSKYVAELWLYKKENVTDYTITQIIDDPLQATLQETFYVSNQTEREFWTKLDVTHLIDKLTTHILDFQVRYGSEIPFLITENKKPLLITFDYRD
ncbi:inhibin beta E chain [Trichonephila clavipes]|nr:inhibin beta E chain [Trichonephila clavipes]